MKILFRSIFILISLQPIAHASSAYYELGLGLSRLQNAAPIFGKNSGLEPSPNPGFAYNAAAAYNFSRATSLLQLHLGLKYRQSSSSTDGKLYSIQGLYPFFRIETPRFYLGGGASPLVIAQKENLIPGLGNMKSGTLGGFVEFAPLWRVVPFFFLAPEISGSMVRSPAGIAPKPELTLSLQMRFYFILDEKITKSGEFDGWRYPFGIEIWDR